MQPVIARRSRRYIPGRRFITAMPLIALLVACGADLVSVGLVKVSTPDDAGEAARAGMTAIEFDRTATPQTAEAAFRAASDVADLHRMSIDKDSFRVYSDGSVELTGHRSAPTMLFKHLPGLKDLTATTATVKASRVAW
jgi:hypothetical protein